MMIACCNRGYSKDVSSLSTDDQAYVSNECYTSKV